MEFVWEHADSFLHCVASPFHSFVTTCEARTASVAGLAAATALRVVHSVWLRMHYHFTKKACSGIRHHPSATAAGTRFVGRTVQLPLRMDWQLVQHS